MCHVQHTAIPNNSTDPPRAPQQEFLRGEGGQALGGAGVPKEGLEVVLSALGWWQGGAWVLESWKCRIWGFGVW